MPIGQTDRLASGVWAPSDLSISVGYDVSGGNAAVTTTGDRRFDAVRAKAEQWADGLIDFGHRNTLLHYKDTKTTTLDLTESEAGALSQFLGGRKTRLSTLLPGKDQHAAACVRARHLRRAMLVLEEEQGVEAGRIARGLIQVTPPTTRGTTPVLPLRAPMLLQTVVLEPRTSAENDYTLDLVGEPEVNPVLLYALNRQFGVDLDIDLLVDQFGAVVECTDDPADQVVAVFDEVAVLARKHNLQVELEARVLAGMFSFEKLPMVKDLRGSVDLLANHDVIAAAAGYVPAMEALRDGATRYHPVSTTAAMCHA